MANSIHIGGGGGGSTPTLITKSITQNGTYLAQDDNADGYSEVAVDVAGGGGNKQISYLKLRITNTRSNPAGNAVQLSEFYLYLNNVLYNWNSNVSITASLPPYSAGESIEHIIDGSVDTKYVTTSWGGTYVGQCDIIISLGETITIDNNTSYAYATGNDEPSRDPVGWTLFGSIDGSNWFALDSRDSANVPTARKTSTEKFSISVGGGSVEYVNISDFAFYYRKNTSTPTVTPISSTEVSLTFQDQNASGYELSSYSVSLEKGVYVAEIKATVNKNTGIDPRYTWGIYSCTTSGWATTNSNSPMDNAGIDTYVPFDTSDTAEHTYEVPINVTADGTAYICFAMAADNGVNATVTVSSLKIRKAYGVESGGTSFKTILTAGVISNDQDYQTATFEDSIGTDDNYLLMRMLKDGSYRYMYLSKSDIPASGEYSFAFSDVQCAISQNAIRATYYSGNWRYIYVDIVGSSDLIFPQSE